MIIESSDRVKWLKHYIAKSYQDYLDDIQNLDKIKDVSILLTSVGLEGITIEVSYEGDRAFSCFEKLKVSQKSEVKTNAKQ
jgi:hypothetical protein